MRARMIVCLTALTLMSAGAFAASKPPTLSSNSGASRWNYTETKDKMRGTTAHIAKLQSSNSLHFSFPYHGGPATLTIRNRPADGLNVMVSVAGQFICHSSTDDTVSVKFDNEPIREFACEQAESGNYNILFIGNEDEFLKSLKSAKKLTIEAEFYQDGTRQMEFNVSNLKAELFESEAADSNSYNSRVAEFNKCIRQPGITLDNVTFRCGTRPTQ